MLLTLFTGCSSEKAEEHRSDLFAMDTYMELKVWCSDGEQALSEASARITELENTFSVTIPESDISKVNHAEGQTIEVSPDTALVVQKGIEISETSSGSSGRKGLPFRRRKYAAPNRT